MRLPKYSVEAEGIRYEFVTTGTNYDDGLPYGYWYAKGRGGVWHNVERGVWHFKGSGDSGKPALGENALPEDMEVEAKSLRDGFLKFLEAYPRNT